MKKIKILFKLILSTCLLIALIAPAGEALADQMLKSRAPTIMEVTINGTTTSYSGEDGWNAAYSSAKNGTPAAVKLVNNWAAAGSMGSGDGFNGGRLAVCGSITLDLNGYYIDRGNSKAMDSGCVIVVQSGGFLAISDSNPKSTEFSTGLTGGVITGGWGNDGAGAIEVEGGSSLIMNGGTIVNCVTNEDGGAIRVTGSEKCSVDLENVRLVNNMTMDSNDKCQGGAIYCSNKECTLIINDCSFEGNYSENSGGAIYINKCAASSINNSVFYGNSCKDYGGAIYYDGSNQINIDGCMFNENIAQNDGGAVYVNADGGAVIADSVFTGNSSSKDGGGIYVNDWNVYLIDDRIEENSAGGKGGGVYVDSMYDLSLQGLMIIRSNTSSSKSSADLCLQNGAASQARFVDGGCEPGSEVWYGTGSDSKAVVCNEISSYQLQYFHTNDKNQKLEDTNEVSEDYVIASTFADGKLWLVIAGIAVIISAAVLAVVIGKRKKTSEREQNEKNR